MRRSRGFKSERVANPRERNGFKDDACVHAKSLQSCPAFCDPMDYNPPGSSVQGFSRQEYWRRLPCPPPGDLLDPVIEPMSLSSPALASGFFTTSTTWEALQG